MQSIDLKQFNLLVLIHLKYRELEHQEWATDMSAPYYQTFKVFNSFYFF